MEDHALQSTMQEVRRAETAKTPDRPKAGGAGVQSPAQKAGSFGSPATGGGNSARDQDELLGVHSGGKKGCCVIS